MAHRGRLLQPVAAEAIREKEIRDRRMRSNNAVLVERVVLVKTAPMGGSMVGFQARIGR